jgi:hypothetical protein
MISFYIHPPVVLASFDPSRHIMTLFWRLAFLALATLPILVHSQQRIPVSGLHTGIADDGKRPARFNINYLHALGGPQWQIPIPETSRAVYLHQYRDLYILGLRAMQQLDQSDPESFFQVAGIRPIDYPF